MPNRQRSASNDKLPGDESSISQAAEVSNLPLYYDSSFIYLNWCEIFLLLVYSILLFIDLEFGSIMARTVPYRNANWNGKRNQKGQKQQLGHKRYGKFGPHKIGYSGWDTSETFIYEAML